MSARVVICCGSGGVGKTTTSAALGLSAAMQGLKVVVLTIDPAKRLADSLNVEAIGALSNIAYRGGALERVMFTLPFAMFGALLGASTRGSETEWSAV